MPVREKVFRAVRPETILEGEIQGHVAFTCDLCFREFDTTAKKHNHKQDHLDKIKCRHPNCNAYFTRDYNMERHFREVFHY